MSEPETPAQRKDRSSRANEAGAGPSPDAEARARRLEEIRQAIVEEWRWREPQKEE